MNKLLPVLGVLDHLTSGFILNFSIIPLKFFHEVRADIAVFLFKLHSYFVKISSRKRLFTVLKLLQNVFGDITSS